MTSRRVNNWPERLALFIEEKRAQPFDWVANNCCFFAADWVAIVRGFDPAAGLREIVRDAATARRVLAAVHGARTVADVTLRAQGCAAIPPAQARRGDVVAIETEAEGSALGVCLGAEAAFAGPAGVVCRPMREAVAAWRI